MSITIAIAKNIIKKKESKEKNCDLCQIPYIFIDFEKDITNNIFDEDTDKTAVCCLLTGIWGKPGVFPKVNRLHVVEN